MLPHGEHRLRDRVHAAGPRTLVHDVHRGGALARRPMSPTIEQTIDRVEQLYATITGHPPPQLADRGLHMPPEIDPVRHVEDQLGRLVSELEQGVAPTSSTPPAWTPRVSAWRDEHGFELLIDVPGVPRDQLELRVSERVLVVSGHRAVPWADGARGASPLACEAPFGRFERAFALPEGVEPSSISARLEAGTLRVRAARSVPSGPSQIPILCS
jgi:HSP20 family molecular chaperone IbpA